VYVYVYVYVYACVYVYVYMCVYACFLDLFGLLLLALSAPYLYTVLPYDPDPNTNQSSPHRQSPQP